MIKGFKMPFLPFFLSMFMNQHLLIAGRNTYPYVMILIINSYFTVRDPGMCPVDNNPHLPEIQWFFTRYVKIAFPDSH